MGHSRAQRSQNWMVQRGSSVFESGDTTGVGSGGQRTWRRGPYRTTTGMGMRGVISITIVSAQNTTGKRAFGVMLHPPKHGGASHNAINSSNCTQHPIFPDAKRLSCGEIVSRSGILTI